MKVAESVFKRPYSISGKLKLTIKQLSVNISKNDKLHCKFNINDDDDANPLPLYETQCLPVMMMMN